MVPARNLQLLCDAHGTPFIRDVAAGVNALTAQPTPRPSHHMAQEPINQDPSKPPPPQERQEVHQEERRGEALVVLPPQQPHPAGTSGSSSGGSSSNGGGGAGGGDWLRLGLGPASPGPSGAAPEIDLFAADRAGTAGPRQEMLPGMDMPPGAFLRPAMPGIPQASLQMSVPRAGPPWLPPWSHAAQQPQLLLPFGHRGLYGPGSPAAGPSVFDTTRVVLPPPAATATAGVWFVFQAAPHQGREPFLPQIPRSYLRIKDGRVTVRLLIKYLANKLGLEDESEVEITCRGRPLLPFMTLQHVRDSIWCQRDAVSTSVAPDTSTANHIMVLQYGRRP